MIIDINGNILHGFDSRDGVIIHRDQYAICLTFDKEQKEKARAISELKTYLNSTDYQAIKFSDGAISEEEYAPIRESRADARRQINEIEDTFVPPYATEDQIRRAIEAAEKNAVIQNILDL